MATGSGHAVAASVFGLGAFLWLARAWRHSQDERADRGRDGKVVDLTPAAVRDPVTRASPESESKQVAEHGKPLPKAFVDKIPEHEVLIIQFLLDYLTARNLPVDGVLVNGGYVRDLLLGKLPDDLDISMCLSKCEEEVTVEWILKDLALYVDELGPSTLKERYKFASMKSVDILGDKSKNKQLDTAKAVFTRMPGSHPLTVEVDLMPTIGEEAYEDVNNRIPTRDQRGTPKQDALRRDLTIGSMLVQVTLDGGTLCWVLLDYYGGLGDLRNGILRAPFPEKLHQGVLCNEDKKLADVVGLDQSSSQQVWWVKILRDDPLRILRVFRFAAKLNFAICPSFWKVICFCLDNLKSKVAGSRKLTEILKLAKYGKDKLAHFIVLCFSKRFVYTLDGQETCLAPVMFGGLDGNSVAHFLPRVLDFDEEMFLSSMVHIPGEIPEDELIGRALVLAIFCTTFIPQSEWKREDSSREEMSVTVDAMIRACNGLCVSNETRDAGLQLLRSYEKVKGILSYSISPVEQLFGSRTGATVDGLSGAQVFGQTHLVWEALDIKKAKIHYAHDVIVHLLKFYVNRECADRVECLLNLLRLSEAPKLTGRGVSTLKRVPPYLRSLLISHLMVLCRLNGVSYDLDAPGSLEAFLQEECKGLLHDLENEWYEAGSDQLKVAYAKTVNTPKKKNKPKASKVKKSPA